MGQAFEGLLRTGLTISIMLIMFIMHAMIIMIVMVIIIVPDSHDQLDPHGIIYQAVESWN